MYHDKLLKLVTVHSNYNELEHNEKSVKTEDIIYPYQLLRIY